MTYVYDMYKEKHQETFRIMRSLIVFVIWTPNGTSIIIELKGVILAQSVHVYINAKDNERERERLCVSERERGRELEREI